MKPKSLEISQLIIKPLPRMLPKLEDFSFPPNYEKKSKRQFSQKEKQIKRMLEILYKSRNIFQFLQPGFEPGTSISNNTTMRPIGVSTKYFK